MPPRSSYAVDVQVGTPAAFRQWTAAYTAGQAPAPAAYGLVDGLQVIRTSLDDLWPPQPAPAEARFQVIAPNMGAEPFLELGALVHITVGSAAEPSRHERFDGVISDLSAAPHELGVVFTVVCVDHLDTLRQATDVTLATAAATSLEQITAVTTATGLGSTTATGLGSGPAVSPIPVEPFGPWDYVLNRLREWVIQDAYNGVAFVPRSRAVIQPRQVGVLTRPTGFEVLPAFEDPNFLGHLRLAYLAGRWRVQSEYPSQTASGALPGGYGYMDAGRIDFGASWTQLRSSGPTSVHVEREDGTSGVIEFLADSPNTNPLQIKVQLTSPAAMAVMAQLYLPGAVPVVRWAADTFTYYATGTAGEAAVPRLLGQVVLIGRLQTRHTPLTRSYYAAQLAARTLTVSGQGIQVEVQLRTPDYGGMVPQQVAWNSPVVTAPGSGRPAPTWANVDPAMTWDDLKNMRGTVI